MTSRFTLGALLVLGLVASAASACTTTVTQPTPTPAPTTEPPAQALPADDAGGPATSGLTAFTQAEVQTLFDDRCVGCHFADNVLDLTAPFTAATVDVAPDATSKCKTSAHRARIAPGDRERSLLWHKVKGTQDCGARMPSGRGNVPLEATELERLGLYIDSL